MIELDELRLTLASAAGAVNVLRGISLKIDRGEKVALTGPSGSGKTSLLMVVGGLERASSGLVRVAGQDLAGLGEDDLARLRRAQIGIVFQSFHLMPAMTALENVALPLELAGRQDAFARAEALLDEVGLSHRLGHYPAQLSGGEQQRVALARAFAPEPGLILADEPTGNLDTVSARDVLDLFDDLHRSGRTVVLITHEADVAAAAGRTIRIRDGQIVGSGPTPVVTGVS
jgi:putative ABC transport system ATP-binding protein